MREQVAKKVREESKPSQQQRQRRKQKQRRTEPTMKALTAIKISLHVNHRTRPNHEVPSVPALNSHPKSRCPCLTGKMMKTRPGSNKHLANTCLSQELASTALTLTEASLRIRPNLQFLAVMTITTTRVTTLLSATISMIRTWKSTESSGTSSTPRMNATSATKSVRSCDAQSVIYSFAHTARIQKARSSDSRKCRCQHGWPSDVDDKRRSVGLEP